jgi:3-methyladenine DNA glycosylase AlkC
MPENSEELYGKGKVKNNYDDLEAEKQIEVDLFRANMNGANHQIYPNEPNKIPQTLVENVTEKYTHAELVNFLLDAQRVKGELRQRLFNNYLKNINKQTVGEKYLNEIFFIK